jgi:hypothetical protein
MHWLYNNKTVTELPEDCVGFVYLITCSVNGRMYIGKKLARFKTLRYKMHTQKNGKKVRKRIRGAVPSDWQDYYGSSDALIKILKNMVKTSFTERYFIIAEAKQNAIILKHVSSLLDEC